ncbi:MAG: M48 family metallopeptidase [Flavobacteriales bacterium]
MKRPALLLIVLLFSFSSCKKVPITGRRQMKLVSTNKMMKMSAKHYETFLDTNKSQVLSDNHPKTKMVREVGKNISTATEEYLKENGYENRFEGFEWEFNVVKSDKVNAWAMSGGKVVFYTGIMEIAEDKNGIAVIMGHEISHAIARHANERMSQGLALKVGGATLGAALSQNPSLTNNLLLRSYGIAGKLGTLAYSRKHEAEADKMGLIFMAKAGYDPHHAPKFWERMSELGGKKPPEFLSTHPSDEKRVKNLKDFMPKAMEHYEE